MPRRFVLAAGLLAAVLALPAPADAAETCDRYAGAFGSDAAAGTATQPYRTAQRLSDSLEPGQTGCLLEGTYTDQVTGPYVLNFRKGGRLGAPVSIRSVPGQRALLRGIIQVPRDSNYVTISDVDIDARRVTPDESVGIQILSEDFTLQDSTITNRSQAICMVVGMPGWGKAVRTVIQRNTFRDCGGTDNLLEHSAYIEWTDGVLITENVFLRSGAYAVHLYPDAHNVTVSHNVMVGNGGGVIFAGEGDTATTDTVVEQNIITDSKRRPGIEAWWGGPKGSANVARDNCLIRNARAQVDLAGGGYAATDNIIADPGFRDPARGDYRLAPNSPCLGVVGYDTAAKLMGAPADPPAAEPSATPAATNTATPVPTGTATPIPTGAPSSAPTPQPTATPTPVVSPPTRPEPTVPPAGEGSQPVADPGRDPVEGARLVIDDAAFSASGGTAHRCRQGAGRCGRR